MSRENRSIQANFSAAASYSALIMISRLFIIVLIGTCCQPADVRDPDTHAVYISFEIDGRVVAGPRYIDIIMKSPRKQLRFPIHEGRFVIPVRLHAGTLDVSLRLEGRRLLFRDVYWTKLRGKWIVGIDTPPFDPENSFPFKDHPPREIWFIDVDPIVADGTRELVAIP